MWVLPLVAWRHRAGLSRVLVVWSSLLLLAYQSARGMPSSADDAVVWLGSAATVACAVVAIVALTTAAVARLRRQSAGSDGADAVPMLTP